MNHTTTHDSCFLLSKTEGIAVSPELTRLINELGGIRAPTWMKAAQKVIAAKGKNLIETGCYRGTMADGCSTVILGQLAKDLGTVLASYEISRVNIAISEAEIRRYGLSPYVWFKDGDSVESLAERETPIDFAYLDSFDCGLGPDYGPCQRHQLAELEVILPLMSPTASILLDDYVPEIGGKTKLTMQRLDALNWDCLLSERQALYSRDANIQSTHYKIAVLTGHLPNYAKLAANTIYHNRAQYCLLHGYDLKPHRFMPQIYQDSQSHASGFSWSRLAEMLRLVTSGNYEWVWCVGVDTLVTNMTIKLESIIDEFGKDKHLLICGEAVAPLQADSFLIRCSPEGAEYLRNILDTYPVYKHHGWVENQAMIDLKDKFESITAHVPQHRLNSYDYRLFYYLGDLYKKGVDCFGNRGQWQPGDFMIHWPAQSLVKRLELLKECEPKIIHENCSAVPENCQTC